MNAPSKDVASILDGDSSLDITLGTDLFVNDQPENPDDCVTIRDSAGYAPDGQLDESIFLRRPGIQVLVRNRDQTEAYSIADAIFHILHAYNNQTISGSRYLLITAISEPLYIGRDENDRAEFSLNFNIMRT